MDADLEVLLGLIKQRIDRLEAGGAIDGKEPQFKENLENARQQLAEIQDALKKGEHATAVVRSAFWLGHMVADLGPPVFEKVAQRSRSSRGGKEAALQRQGSREQVVEVAVKYLNAGRSWQDLAGLIAPTIGKSVRHVRTHLANAREEIEEKTRK